MGIKRTASIRRIFSRFFLLGYLSSYLNSLYASIQKLPTEWVAVSVVTSSRWSFLPPPPIQEKVTSPVILGRFQDNILRMKFLSKEKAIDRQIVYFLLYQDYNLFFTIEEIKLSYAGSWGEHGNIYFGCLDISQHLVLIRSLLYICCRANTVLTAALCVPGAW